MVYGNPNFRFAQMVSANGSLRRKLFDVCVGARYSV